jgi:hypothetical protein
MPTPPQAKTSVDREQAFARSERMVGRRIAGEYILVPIVGRGADVEAIYNLNGLGAFIWERFDGKTTGETIVRAIVDRYDVTAENARRDYRRFVTQLQSIQALK